MINWNHTSHYGVLGEVFLMHFHLLTKHLFWTIILFILLLFIQIAVIDLTQMHCWYQTCSNKTIKGEKNLNVMVWQPEKMCAHSTTIICSPKSPADAPFINSDLLRFSNMSEITTRKKIKKWLLYYARGQVINKSSKINILLLALQTNKLKIISRNETLFLFLCWVSLYLSKQRRLCYLSDKLSEY